MRHLGALASFLASLTLLHCKIVTQFLYIWKRPTNIEPEWFTLSSLVENIQFNACWLSDVTRLSSTQTLYKELKTARNLLCYILYTLLENKAFSVSSFFSRLPNIVCMHAVSNTFFKDGPLKKEIFHPESHFLSPNCRHIDFAWKERDAQGACSRQIRPNTSGLCAQSIIYYLRVGEN